MKNTKYELLRISLRPQLISTVYYGIVRYTTVVSRATYILEVKVAALNSLQMEQLICGRKQAVISPIFATRTITTYMYS